AREVLQLAVNDGAQALDLLPEICALEVLTQRLERIAPARGVLSGHGTVAFALAEAGRLLEIDFRSQARAGIPAGIAHQRPAGGPLTLAIVLDVLLGDVGIVPLHLRVEASARRVVVHADHDHAGDAFQRVERGSGTETIEWIRPGGPITQID